MIQKAPLPLVHSHSVSYGRFKRRLVDFLSIEYWVFSTRVLNTQYSMERKLSFEKFKIHGIFITADRSALLVLKRHHAANFLKNFQVHFVLYSQAFVNILSLTFYTFWGQLERPDLRFVLNNFCHVLSRFYLRERIHEPNLCHANCFWGLIYGPLNKNFREIISIVVRSFID